MACQYASANLLRFTDHITNGFYDAGRNSDRVAPSDDAAAILALKGKVPSRADLLSDDKDRKIVLPREIIAIHSEHDEALSRAIQSAQERIRPWADPFDRLLSLVEFARYHTGMGLVPRPDQSAIYRQIWREMQKNKASVDGPNVVMPLGLVFGPGGECRHIALLIKYIADLMHLHPEQWRSGLCIPASEEARKRSVLLLNGQIAVGLMRGSRRAQPHVWNTVAIDGKICILDATVESRPDRFRPFNHPDYNPQLSPFTHVTFFFFFFFKFIFLFL